MIPSGALLMFVQNVIDHIEDDLLQMVDDRALIDAVRIDNQNFHREVEQLLDPREWPDLFPVMHGMNLRTVRMDDHETWRNVADNDATQAVRLVLQPFIPEIFGSVPKRVLEGTLR